MSLPFVDTYIEDEVFEFSLNVLVDYILILFEFWFKFVKLSLVTLSFANAVDIDNETNNIKVKTIISLYFSFYSSIN